MPFPGSDIAGGIGGAYKSAIKGQPPVTKASIPDGVWLSHVAEAVRILAGTFNVPASTYEGHGVQPGGASTAADFLMGSWGTEASGSDKAKGDSMAGFLDDNWSALNVRYVIWFDQIKGVQTGGSWIQYPHEWKAAYGTDDGSPSVKHTDHVHVSFEQTGSMPDMNSLTPPTGKWNQISGAGSGGPLGDLIGRLAEIIASGFANALLRFVKAVYAYTILRPLDFAGGFWWELTKKVTGYQQSWKSKGDPNVFSEENRKRLWTMIFLIFSYYLAFGRDKDTGEHHLDRMINGGANMLNRDLEGSEGYNDVARIRADVQGVTVARRRQKHTVRRKAGDTGRRESAKRRVTATPQRDGRGRFVAERSATPEEEEVGRRKATRSEIERRE